MFLHEMGSYPLGERCQDLAGSWYARCEHGCYDRDFTLLCRCIRLHFFLYFLSSFTEAPCMIQSGDDFAFKFCTIQSEGCLVYDIHLGATTTTILSVRGVTIPIDLVSSATDSFRRHIVLFKLYHYQTQTLSLSSCVNRASVAQNLQTPWTPHTPGKSPTPSSPRIIHTAIVPVLSLSTWSRNSVTRELNVLVAAPPLKLSRTFHLNVTMVAVGARVQWFNGSVCYVTAGTFARRGLGSTAKTLRSLSGVSRFWVLSPRRGLR